MTKRIAVAVASCLALVACGGDSGGNAAVGKTFTYGTATSYSTYSMDTQLSGALAVGSAADAASAGLVANADGLANSLLGSSSIGLATSPAQQQALAVGARAAVSQLAIGGSGQFDYVYDNPGCVTTTANSVTMKACTVTANYGSYGYTSKVVVDGSLTYDQATGALTWDLTVTDSTTISYSGQSGSNTVRLHESGKLTVTATTIQGQMLADLSMSVSSAGVSESLAVAEAVILDVTYADAAVCSSRVTSGTVEAKRVWTDRGGANAVQLPDEAAKITWTACGVGTIVHSQ